MIAAQLLSPASQSIGWLLYLPVVLWAAWRAPWLELLSDIRRQHLLGGTVLALFVLWLVRRDFDSGLSLHFIGLTAVTLLLDWPLAVVAGLAAQLGLVVIGRQDLAALGVNGLLLVAIPVLITEVCAARVERAQPRNLFVYIFFSGFFPAALAALFCILAGVALLWLDGLWPMPPWLFDFAGFVWLITFPEAFINGTVVSALVVFYPDWLETFNRSRYLQAPWKDDEPPGGLGL
ncbi:MAG: energy-coupling factor ABC transporter permease [Pseudomonadota bacterium]